MKRALPRMTMLASLCVGLFCLSNGVNASNILTDALGAMAPNSWQRLNLNEFQSVWTPLDQRPTPDSPSSNISAWSGAAWDSLRKNMYVWGGDIGNEQGNEVYIFSAITGLWSRGALPSQITQQANGYFQTVDGIFHSPVSGESWDNLVYLTNVDRLAVIGVSREGNTFQDSNGMATGPYFWDPSKADPNKVSGITGSHVNPATYTDVVGGEMWQNRNNFLPPVDFAQSGVTAHVSKNGKDVVYFATRYDYLYRYTVSDLDPAHDTWEQIGRRPISGVDGEGAGTFDPSREIFMKTLTNASFGFWDVNRPHNSTNENYNREIEVIPNVISGTAPLNLQHVGIEYDPTLDGYIVWEGDSRLWLLKPPAGFGKDASGYYSDGSGWTLEELDPNGIGPGAVPGGTTGVFGKWLYLPQEKAYMGVMDSISGDVYLYKPGYLATPVPLPAPVWLFLSGLGVLFARRPGKGSKK